MVGDVNDNTTDQSDINEAEMEETNVSGKTEAGNGIQNLLQLDGAVNTNKSSKTDKGTVSTNLQCNNSFKSLKYSMGDIFVVFIFERKYVI